jgi:hypothetical protein
MIKISRNTDLITIHDLMFESNRVIGITSCDTSTTDLDRVTNMASGHPVGLT